MNTEQDSEKMRTKLQARATLHAAKKTRDLLGDAAIAAIAAERTLIALQEVQSSTEAAKKAAAATVAAVDAAELAAIRAVAIAAGPVPVPVPVSVPDAKKAMPPTKRPERWQESSLSYLRAEDERKQAAEDRVRYALQHPELWHNKEPPVLMTNRPDGADLHMRPPRAVNFRSTKTPPKHPR